MIALAKPSQSTFQQRRPPRRRRSKGARLAPTWNDGYLRLLPAIRRQAWARFRSWRAEAREEAVQEIIADTCVAYTRLVALGKEHLAYATPLVTFALKKYRAGRRVGARQNVRDTLSEYCQRRKRVRIERLSQFDESSGHWEEIAVEDRLSSPADVAAIRVDFRDWLQTLNPRDRHLAEKLAIGETTSSVARMFAISQGRVSQLRLELYRSWQQFIGEPVTVVV